MSAATAFGGAAVAYAGYVVNTWLRYGRDLVDSPSQNILADHYLRDYEVRERHETVVRAPAEATWDVARHLDLRRSPVIRAIFATRELLLRSADRDAARPAEFVDEAIALGWGVLAEEPGRRLVFGAVTRPWEANVKFIALPKAEFASFDSPRFAKIIWTLEVDQLTPTTSVFRTETRVTTTDADSRRRFRLYWSLLSPGILLIRRETLRMVKCEAQRRST